MYLNYANIESRCAEPPVLRLQTLSGKTLGAIPYVHNLKFEINYSELSTIEFEVPYMVDGAEVPLYRNLESYKVVYTEDHGIYVLMSPSLSGDGIKETKVCRGYSLETLFEQKRLFLPEGTYDFWNPGHPDNTVLGLVLSLDTDWSPGYIDPKLIGCYRTFDEYTDDALGFLYDTATEKYNCVIVADVYSKTLSAYHTSTDRGSLPIYLDYHNLVESTKVEELTDDMITKLHPYGSDNFSIAQANPIGTDYLIDLSYFVANGDLDVTVGGNLLSERYLSWQEEVVAAQESYMRLTAMRNTKTALRLTIEAEIVDLEGEMSALEQEQSAILYLISKGDRTEEYLTGINAEIAEKQEEIDGKTAERDAIQSEIDGFATQINTLCKPLIFSTYFTSDEQRILNRYLIEGDVTDETFVETAVSDSFPSVLATVTDELILIQNTTCTLIEPVNDGDATYYQLKGGTTRIADMTAEVVTMIVECNSETDDDGNTSHSCVISGQLSQIKQVTEDGEVLTAYEGGLLTISGTHNGVETGSDEETGLPWLSVDIIECSRYLTADVGEFHSANVAKELYDYGANVLDECAWPTMEFSLDAANFLFLTEFAQFKDNLDLGCGVHLNLGSEGHITANLIGVSIDYENDDSLSLTFSNQYQRKNGVKTLKDMIVGASSSGRSFDASKFTYNQNTNKTNSVARLLEGNFEAAKNKVLSGEDVHVSIQGSGIHIGDGDYQIRIVDSMIAMTKDSWNSVSTAIGHFNSDYGSHWGVNAEMLAGKLLVGEKMVIENDNLTFKLDDSGAWLYNSQLLIQRTDADGNVNGQIMIHPDYGIVAGKDGIYTAEGTTVTPGFLDENGEITFDDDGMPEDVSFYLDMDGNAYFRGNVYADNGIFNGVIYATDGEFTGTLKATYLDGELIGDDDSWLVGSGIAVGGSGTYTANNYNFHVDSSGNVSIKSGTIAFAALDGAESAGTASSYLSSLVNGRWRGGSFIDGWNIVSGRFFATGKAKSWLGRYYSSETDFDPAFYVCDPDDIDSNKNQKIVGSLSYDKLDADEYDSNGNVIAAAKRVLLSTQDGTVLKLISGGNMSIDANGILYIAADNGVSVSGELRSSSMYTGTLCVATTSGYTTSYGWGDPPTTAELGQVYFKLSS